MTILQTSELAESQVIRELEVSDAIRSQRFRELAANETPAQPSWFPELQRLKHLEQDFAFLPVGWGSEYKAPMFYGKHHKTTPEDWTKQSLTIDELLRWDRTPYCGIGARTGLHTGPLMAFDFDGESSVDFACEIGLAPWGFNSWHVHRDNDPWRLKVLCRPTLDQLSQLPSGHDGSIEFQGSTSTKPKTEGSKGEALEVFFYGGRQVVVLGEHRSSGGNYLWPVDLGPEQLAPPPQAWLDYAIHIAKKFQDQTPRSSRPSSSQKNGTRRLSNCPICGRHAGKGGSSLWCDETTKGLIFCMEGNTFSAEQAHGRLTSNQVVQTVRGAYKFLYSKGNAFVFAPQAAGAK